MWYVARLRLVNYKRDRGNQLTNNEVMTYEEARKQLKEVEILLNHREPVRVYCEELSENVTGVLGIFPAFLLSITGVAGAVVMGNYLMLLLPVLPIAWCIARCYDGHPESKISRFLSKILLTKKQRAIQSKANQFNAKYQVQQEIFDLFVETKKDKLVHDGVFKALHDGVQETYPWINEWGKVKELSPQEWRKKNLNLEIDNDTRTADNLKELIANNPELAKAITIQPRPSQVT